MDSQVLVSLHSTLAGFLDAQVRSVDALLYLWRS